MAKSKSRTTKTKAKPAPRSEPKAETKSEAKADVKVEATLDQTASASTAKPETASEAAPSPAKATPKRAPAGNRRIAWLHVTTVISATILIGAEVFGAAFAGSWALATLFGFGYLGARILDILLMLCGLAVMVQFVRAAHLIEPFTVRE